MSEFLLQVSAPGQDQTVALPKLLRMLRNARFKVRDVCVVAAAHSKGERAERSHTSELKPVTK